MKEGADMLKQTETSGKLEIIYDGECPFCTSYVKMVRLKESFDTVELISAREDHPLVKEMLDKGYDLDNGMIVKHGETIYYGSDAVNFMSVMSSDAGLFNRLLKELFKYKLSAKIAYPFLRFGRNSVLFLKGSKQLNAHYKDKNIHQK